MLFSDQRRHALNLPAKDQDGNPSTIAFLIHHLCEHVMKDTRKELFVLDNHMYVSPSPPPPLLSPHRLLSQWLVFVGTLYPPPYSVLRRVTISKIVHGWASMRMQCVVHRL